MRFSSLNAAVGLVFLAAGAGLPHAAEITATPKITFTVGEDVINSLIAYRLAGGYTVSEGGNSMTLTGRDIFIDFEPATTTFSVGAEVSWNVDGMAGSKSISLSRTVANTDYIVDATVNVIKLKDALFSGYTDIPAWVRGKMEAVVNQIYPLQGIMGELSAGINNLDRQVIDNAAIYSTGEFTLTAAAGQDQISMSIGNKVRFAQRSIDIWTGPNPAKNDAFTINGQANEKFRIKKASIHFQSGTVLLDVNSGDVWSAKYNQTYNPYFLQLPNPGLSLANGLYDWVFVGENSLGAWNIVNFTQAMSK